MSWTREETPPPLLSFSLSFTLSLSLWFPLYPPLTTQTLYAILYPTLPVSVRCKISSVAFNACAVECLRGAIPGNYPEVMTNQRQAVWPLGPSNISHVAASGLRLFFLLISRMLRCVLSKERTRFQGSPHLPSVFLSV